MRSSFTCFIMIWLVRDNQIRYIGNNKVKKPEYNTRTYIEDQVEKQ